MQDNDKQLLNELMVPILKRWGRDTVLRSVDELVDIFGMLKVEQPQTLKPLPLPERLLTHEELGALMAEVAGQKKAE